MGGAGGSSPTVRGKGKGRGEGAGRWQHDKWPSSWQFYFLCQMGVRSLGTRGGQGGWGRARERRTSLVGREQGQQPRGSRAAGGPVEGRPGTSPRGRNPQEVAAAAADRPSLSSVPVSRPVLTLSPAGPWALEGDTMTFHCEARRGSAPILYQFFHEGALVRKLRAASSGGSSFSVSLTAEHSGSYHCTADNGLGAQPSEAESLSINGRPWAAGRRAPSLHPSPRGAFCLRVPSPPGQPGAPPLHVSFSRLSVERSKCRSVAWGRSPERQRTQAGPATARRTLLGWAGPALPG